LAALNRSSLAANPKQEEEEVMVQEEKEEEKKEEEERHEISYEPLLQDATRLKIC